MFAGVEVLPVEAPDASAGVEEGDAEKAMAVDDEEKQLGLIVEADTGGGVMVELSGDTLNWCVSAEVVMSILPELFGNIVDISASMLASPWVAMLLLNEKSSFVKLLFISNCSDSTNVLIDASEGIVTGAVGTVGTRG